MDEDWLQQSLSGLCDSKSNQNLVLSYVLAISWIKFESKLGFISEITTIPRTGPAKLNQPPIKMVSTNNMKPLFETQGLSQLVLILFQISNLHQN